VNDASHELMEMMAPRVRAECIDAHREPGMQYAQMTLS
jgi:hypothetical protein